MPLSDTKSAIILSICPVTAMTPIGVKLWTMVHIGPGHSVPFWRWFTTLRWSRV